MKKYIKTKKITNEIICYVIVGAITTLVSLITYYLFSRILQINYYISNILSWICAVTFAFFSNKKFVYKNTSSILTSSIKFLLSRVFSLLEEMLLLWFIIEVMQINDIIGKFIIQFIVIVTNYITGKFYAFKEKRFN